MLVFYKTSILEEESSVLSNDCVEDDSTIVGVVGVVDGTVLEGGSTTSLLELASMVLIRFISSEFASNFLVINFIFSFLALMSSCKLFVDIPNHSNFFCAKRIQLCPSNRRKKILTIIVENL